MVRFFFFLLGKIGIEFDFKGVKVSMHLYKLPFTSSTLLKVIFKRLLPRINVKLDFICLFSVELRAKQNKINFLIEFMFTVGFKLTSMMFFFFYI